MSGSVRRPPGPAGTGSGRAPRDDAPPLDLTSEADKHTTELAACLNGARTLAAQVEALAHLCRKVAARVCVDDDARRLAGFAVSVLARSDAPVVLQRVSLSLLSAARRSNAAPVDDVVLEWLSVPLREDALGGGELTRRSIERLHRVFDEDCLRQAVRAADGYAATVDCVWSLMGQTVAADAARLRDSPYDATAVDRFTDLARATAMLLTHDGAGVSGGAVRDVSAGAATAGAAHSAAPGLAAAFLSSLASGRATDKDALTHAGLAAGQALRVALSGVAPPAAAAGMLAALFVGGSGGTGGGEGGGAFRVDDVPPQLRQSLVTVAAALRPAAQCALARGVAVAAPVEMLQAPVSVSVSVSASARAAASARAGTASSTSSQSPSLLCFVLLPAVLAHCEAGDGSLRTFALQSLEALLHAARRVTTASAAAAVDADTATAVSAIVLRAWERPERRTAALMPALFDAILDLQAQRGGGDAGAGGGAPLPPLALHLLHVAAPAAPARCHGLLRLLPRTTATHLLRARPRLLAELVDASARPGDVTTAPSDLARALLIALRRELEAAMGLPPGAPAGGCAQWRRSAPAAVGDGGSAARAVIIDAGLSALLSSDPYDPAWEALPPWLPADLAARARRELVAVDATATAVASGDGGPRATACAVADAVRGRADATAVAAAATSSPQLAPSSGTLADEVLHAVAARSWAAAWMPAILRGCMAPPRLTRVRTLAYMLPAVLAADVAAAAPLVVALRRAGGGSGGELGDDDVGGVDDDEISGGDSRGERSAAAVLAACRLVRATAGALPVLPSDVAEPSPAAHGVGRPPRAAALLPLSQLRAALLLPDPELRLAAAEVAGLPPGGSTASRGPPTADEYAAVAAFAASVAKAGGAGDVRKRALRLLGAVYARMDGGLRVEERRCDASVATGGRRAEAVSASPTADGGGGGAVAAAPAARAALRASVSAALCFVTRLVRDVLLPCAYGGAPVDRVALPAEMLRLTAEAFAPGGPAATAARLLAGHAAEVDDAVAADGGEPNPATASSRSPPSLLARLFPAPAVTRLLNLCTTPWERVRGSAMGALTALPPPLAGLSSPAHVASLVRCALELTASPRQRECDGGALLLRLVFARFVAREGWTVRLVPLVAVIVDDCAPLSRADGIVAQQQAFIAQLLLVVRQRADAYRSAVACHLDAAAADAAAVACGVGVVGVGAGADEDGCVPVAAHGHATAPHPLPHGALLALRYVLRELPLINLGVAAAIAAGADVACTTTQAAAQPTAAAPVTASAAVTRWRPLFSEVLGEARACLQLAQTIVAGAAGVRAATATATSTSHDGAATAAGSGGGSGGGDEIVILSAGRVDCGHRLALPVPPSASSTNAVPAAAPRVAVDAAGSGARSGGGVEQCGGANDSDGDDGSVGRVAPDDTGGDDDGDADGGGYPASTGVGGGLNGESPAFLVVVGAWLLAREAAQLLGEVVATAPLPTTGGGVAAGGSTATADVGSGSDPWLVSGTDAGAAGSALLGSLLVVKHYGAMHHAAAALTDVARTLLRLPLPAQPLTSTAPVPLPLLPAAWLSELLLRLTGGPGGAQSQFILRRSAGFAAAFVSLLEAEAATKQQHAAPTTLHHAALAAGGAHAVVGSGSAGGPLLRRAAEALLLAAGADAAATAAAVGRQLPAATAPLVTPPAPSWRVRVHALNVLRLLFKHSPLGDAVVPFVAVAVAAAVAGFDAPAWAVRNSAMMLFAAATERALGTAQRNVAGAGEDAVKKLRWSCGGGGSQAGDKSEGGGGTASAATAGITAAQFFVRFPGLRALILGELQRGAASASTFPHSHGDAGLAPALPPATYPLLLLLSRLHPASSASASAATVAPELSGDGGHSDGADDDDDAHLAFAPSLLAIVANARHAMVRRMAARALAALMPGRVALESAIAAVARALPPAHGAAGGGRVPPQPWNAVHGRLLVLRALLSRLNAHPADVRAYCATGGGAGVAEAADLREALLHNCAPLAASAWWCDGHSGAGDSCGDGPAGVAPTLRPIPGLVRAVAVDVCALAELVLPMPVPVPLPPTPAGDAQRHPTWSAASAAATIAAAALGILVGPRHAQPACDAETSTQSVRLNLGDGVLAAAAARTLVDDVAAALLHSCRVCDTDGVGGVAAASSRIALIARALAHDVAEARVASARAVKAALKHCVPPLSGGAAHCAALVLLRPVLFARLRDERHPDAVRHISAAVARLLQRQGRAERVDASLPGRGVAAWTPESVPSASHAAAVLEWALLLHAHDASRDTDARAHLLRACAELLRPLLRPRVLHTDSPSAFDTTGVDAAAATAEFARRACSGLASMRAHRLRLAAGRAMGAAGALGTYLVACGGSGTCEADAAGAEPAAAAAEALAACWGGVVAALSDFDDEVRDAARRAMLGALDVALDAARPRAAALASSGQGATARDGPTSRVTRSGELLAALADMEAEAGAAGPLPAPQLRDVIAAVAAGPAACVTDAAALHVAFVALVAWAWRAPQTLALLRSMATVARQRGGGGGGDARAAATTLSAVPLSDGGSSTTGDSAPTLVDAHAPAHFDAHAPPRRVPRDDFFLHRTLFVVDADNDFEEPAEVGALAAAALAAVCRRLRRCAGDGGDGGQPAAELLAAASVAADVARWAARRLDGDIGDAPARTSTSQSGGTTLRVLGTVTFKSESSVGAHGQPHTSYPNAGRSWVIDEDGAWMCPT